MDTDYIPIEIIDHTADMGIVARGCDLKSLFRNAALGLVRLIVSGPPVKSDKTEKVMLEGGDAADLLVKWLGEILYLLQGEELVTVEARVKFVSMCILEAELDVAGFDPTRHEMILDVKAVTYHQSMVWNDGNHWLGRVILDL
ncbi:MAG TPA: archease [Desulfobacteraceae bacterium]|nr:archease [Desulfobacteraceae bacterium]